MERKIRLFYAVLFLFFIMMALSCGGSKPVIEEPLNDFPELPPQPVEQPREPVETPDISEDIPQKPPLRLQTVNFDFDKSALTEQAKDILAQNAIQLQQHTDAFIRIEGHCDERGTVEYNLALGERRALAVRNYLINFGIAPGRLTVISYGKERPIDPRHNESAWAVNRRAEFVVLNQ